VNAIIIILGIISVLFVLTYLTKRRFGVLGLALSAGAILSELWSKDITPYIKQAGLEIVAPPLETIVTFVIILLPALLLLFSGPSYSKKSQRIIGSAAFALLATAFLLEPLGNALIFTGEGLKYYTLLTDNRAWIVTAGLLFALFDILSIKQIKPAKE
jgi:hypothetical protein